MHHTVTDPEYSSNRINRVSMRASFFLLLKDVCELVRGFITIHCIRSKLLLLIQTVTSVSLKLISPNILLRDHNNLETNHTVLRCRKQQTGWVLRWWPYLKREQEFLLTVILLWIAVRRNLENYQRKQISVALIPTLSGWFPTTTGITQDKMNRCFSATFGPVFGT